jgi:hypothetical protein
MTGEPRFRESIENPFGLSPDQERRAARVVASASTDVTDCTMLLDVLGLRPSARPAFDDNAV